MVDVTTKALLRRLFLRTPASGGAVVPRKPQPDEVSGFLLEDGTFIPLAEALKQRGKRA
jgi:hypothetical protein